MIQIRRPHYFKGQFLKKDDFIAEQEYHLKMRRLHNSSLHTWGIVDGLNITADDTVIKISPGSAIDSQGREIWFPLSDDKTPPVDTPLAIPPSTANGGYFVVLTYKEDYDPLSPYPAAGATDSDDSKFIRKYETGEPSLIPATPASANDATLKLALVNITAGKVTGQLDLSVRRNAGSFRASGGNLEIRPVIRDGSVVVVGDLIINSKNKILLKDGDRNHGVRYSWEEFAGKRLDGPVMYGYGGGALGVKHYNPSREEIALSWDGSGKVAIGTRDFRAKLVVKGGSLEQVPGKFSTRSGAENAGRVFAGADGDLTSVNAGDLVEMFDERREVESVAADRKSLTVKGSSLRVYPEGTPLYVMRPDLTTPIFRADDYKGDPKVLITSDGNVGIGTADPKVRLHLKFPDIEKGTAAVLNLEGKDHVYVQWYPLGFDKGRKAWMGYASADEKNFTLQNEFADGHLLLLSGSGRVGIGVTNPQCELDVMGQVVIRKDGLRFAKEDGGWYPDGWIGMWREKADSPRWMHIGGITDDDKERRIFLAGSCINLNGKVGIGTFSPSTDLEIRRDVTGALGPILTLFSNGGTGSGGAIDFNSYDPGTKNGARNPSSARISSIDDGKYSNHLAFSTRIPSAPGTGAAAAMEKALTERVRISSDGNVGIATADPQARLAVKTSLLPIDQVQGSFQTMRGAETQLGSEGADLSKIRRGDIVEMSGVRRKVTDVKGPDILVETPGFTASAIPATIKVFRAGPAIRVEDPDGRTAFAVSGNGIANISGGSSYAAEANRMAPGSLTLGSCDASFGGGESWSNNTAGLLLETSNNTEIAVNNHMKRLMSLMYYEGGDVNRISIGRSMGAGAISKLVLNGSVGIGKPGPRTALDTGTGVMSGAANDYQKAQYTMSGGGMVTWGGPGKGLKWSNRIIAISMGGRPECFTEGFVDIVQPKTNIPATQVYDGSPRAASEGEGVILKQWEALYAIHVVGGNQSAVTFRIEAYTKDFYAPSNWLLVALVNGDDGSVKLGTGAIVSAKSSSSKSSPIPCGTIVMWYGAVADIPDGWALCNGQNGTPDLRGRFVMGAGGNYGPNVMAGEESVTLGIEHLPPHNHANGDRNQLLRANSQDGCTTGGLDRTDSEPNVRDQSATIQTVGGGRAHENRPPFCTLCFIMKVFT